MNAPILSPEAKPGFGTTVEQLKVAASGGRNPASGATLLEAVNLALHHAMEEDESVVVLGEDVGANGGVFRATDHLRERFGYKRVMDTPLAEALIAGVSVGMATHGLRPVAEIQFMGFIYATVENLICHAARMRNRTRGRLSCPMVVRAPFGGGIHAPEHHSESTEALFAHIPGLKTVVASAPDRAYGLLLSAIRSPDPVIFLEPKRLYRAQRSILSAPGTALPLDKAFVVREGRDITLVSWGASMYETMQAADALAEEHIDCEVIDLATISPFDKATILESVRKTGRCCVIHEAARNGGFGAEIAATVGEFAFPLLRCAVTRVTGYDTIMPYFKNERYYLPSIEKIMDTARAMANTAEMSEAQL